jgi:hypothetical protein
MSLTEKAMLAKLSFSIVGMRKKDIVATTKVNNLLFTSPTAGMYQKCRIERKDILDVIHAKDRASALHRKMTTPFTRDGWNLISSDTLIEYGKDMSIFKQQFFNAVADVQRRWPAIVASQQQRLGPIFNQNEYPTQAELNDEFDFEHELRPVPSEGHVILDLEAEALNEIKEMIRKENEDNTKRSMKDMWERLLKPVANMADICSNDKKIFGSLIDKIESIVDILPRLNIINDVDLNNMADEIRSKLLGHTVGQLRDDKYLKRTLGAEAEVISGKMKGYMDNTSTIQ